MQPTHTKSTIMKKLYSLLLVLTFIASAQPLFSQKATVGDLEREPLNFYEIQERIGSKWKDKPPKKGDGFKQYKRWEYFWEGRTNLDGTFPSPEMIETDWRDYQAKHPEARTSAFSTGTWKELGPQSTDSGYFGIGRVNCIAFHPTDRNTIWVGTPSGGLWKSTDGGQNWSTNTDKLLSVISLGISSIAINPQDPNVMYLATGDARKGFFHPLSLGVFKSTDGGNTWNIAGQLPAGVFEFYINELLLHPSNPNIIFAATTMGLYRSDNAGASWNLITSEQEKCYDIAFRPGSSSIIYLSTANHFYQSTDGGASWGQPRLRISNSKRTQIAVTPDNPGYVALVSSHENSSFNGFFESNNSGRSWREKYGRQGKNLLEWRSDGRDRNIGQGNYDLCIAISPTDYRTVFIGGVNLWKTTNGGSNWTVTNFWTDFSGDGYNPGVATVHADKHVLVWQDNNTLFEGNDGGIYKTTNGGNSWTDLSENLVISQFYKLGVSASDNKVIGGLQDNGTKLKNSAGNWSEVEGGDGMECFFDPVNSNLMYGEAFEGQLFRVENGNTIRGLNCLSPQECLRGAWVTPWAMDPNNRQVLYAGYDQVWKSTNRGDSWQPISPIFTDHKLRSLAIAPSNSNVIYTASLTQLFKTSDGGANWFDITAGLPSTVQGPYISYITVDPQDPNIIYVTFHNYVRGEKVYQSTNEGSSWTNITGSLPVVPANCLTIQPDRRDALYIGTDVGVFYRDNTMDDWVAYIDGLPTVIVTELECKASTGKIIAATFGRGIWEADFFEGGGPTDELAITPSVQNVDKAAGTVRFSIQSNQSWTLSEEERWLTLSQTSGDGNATVNASYQVNTGRTSREATITLSSESGTKTAKIIQQGADGGGGGGRCNQPSNLRVYDVEQTEATLSWVPVSGAASYTVTIRASPNGSWQTLSPEFLQTTTVPVTGFAAGTTYEWRVKTNCANGETSSLATGPQFTTDAAPNCNAPGNLQTSNIGQDGATLSWSTVQGAREYGVQIRKLPGGGWTNLSPATTTSTSVGVGGLSANTTYEWRVRTFCTNGLNSNYSSTKSFTTTQAAACNTPVGLQTSDITSSSAVIDWALVSGAANYTVQAREGNSQWQDINPPNWDSGPITFNGLSPSTNYQWRVRANCSNGLQSSWSSPRSFTTLPAPSCNTPGGLQTYNVTETSVDINWALVSGATNYTIQTRISGGQWQNVNPATWTSGPLTINSLDPNTSYQWRIRSNCSNGLQSSWSSPRSFTTLPPPTCNTPSGLQTFGVTTTTVNIDWNLVSGASSYTVQTRISGGPWFDLNPSTWTSGPLTINSLNPNTSYQWRIRTNCSNGLQSSWSSPRSFTTLPLPTCNTPGGLFVTNLTRNTVVLRWSPVSGAASYQVQFNSNTGWFNLQGGVTNTNSLFVSGLFPNSYYEWRVIAGCSNGLVSFPSNTAWFITATLLEPNVTPEHSLSRITPQEVWQTQDLQSGQQYLPVQVQAGQQYTFSLCAEDGGSNQAANLYLRSSDGRMITIDEGSCDKAPRITWLAAEDGEVHLWAAINEEEETQTKLTLAYKGSIESDGSVPYRLGTPVLEASNQALPTLDPDTPLAIEVFPNPSNGQFQIQFNNLADIPSAQLFIYDATGRRLWRRDQSIETGLNTWSVNATEWENGIYIVRLISQEGKQATKKIYISR